MANIRKQFNFRNGVQVDDDNLVVSPTGLVGIGTTIPTEFLDVRGTAKVVGLVTASEIYTPNLTAESGLINNLTLNNTITGSGVSIGSGIVTSSGVGVVTYYGDGGRLLNLPTSQWLDVNIGLGFTSIYAQGFVGVGTNDPRFLFQVSGSPNTSLVGFTSGVGISSSGNILATGIVTAYKFSGIGSDLIDLNASNIAYGTISNDRIPVLLNSKMPANISVSGIITAQGGFIGTVTGDVTGNIIGNVVGLVTGDVVGIASTARSLIGNPNILVNNITATSIAVTSITNVTSIGSTNINLTGIITSSALNIGDNGATFNVSSSTNRIGFGTTTPTKDVQFHKTGQVELELIGSNSSRLIIGQVPVGPAGFGNSTAELRFGTTARTLDIINSDSGGINQYIHTTPPIVGVETGNFNWIYGQTFQELMTLTYYGALGIGITNPDSNIKLHVAGISTHTGDVYVDGNVYVTGNINGTLSGDIIAGGLFSQTGVSTAYDLNVINNGIFESIGIGTNNPIERIDARTTTALFSRIGLGITNPQIALDASGGDALFAFVGVGTTAAEEQNGIVVSDGDVTLKSTSVFIDGLSSVGIGTTDIRCAVDLSDAGRDISGGQFRYMLPPRLTTAERVGLSTEEGAFIFNVDTKKFQGYTGIAWTDFN